MVDYNERLKERRRNIERKKYVDKELQILTEQRAGLEKELEYLKIEYEKARKKLNVLENSVIFTAMASVCFIKNITDRHKTSARSIIERYKKLQNCLESTENDIQKTWNESVSLKYAQQSYNNIVADITELFAQGKTDTIDAELFKQEQIACLKDRIIYCEEIIKSGTKVVEFIDRILLENRIIFSQEVKELKKLMTKFRTDVNDISAVSKINLDFRTGKYIPDWLGVDYKIWHMNFDSSGKLPVSIEMPVSLEEQRENFGSAGFETEKIIAETKKKIEEIKCKIIEIEK